jgi:hypothetical protein
MQLLKKPLFYITLLFILIVVLAIIILNFSSTQNPNSFLSNLTKPHPGSCLILEEKYCKTVKFINDPRFKGLILAVYKLDKDALVFSPFDGIYSNIKASTGKNESGQISYSPGIIAQKNIHTNDLPDYSITFVFYNNTSRIFDNNSVKKAEILGTVSDKTINSFDNYNLIVEATRYKLQNSKVVFLPGNDILKQILNFQ